MLVISILMGVAGAGDWRLPNIKELTSINDEARVRPSLKIFNLFFREFARNLEFWMLDASEVAHLLKQMLCDY